MYQALYRKYRPILFKDVVGQKAVVKVLKNSISNHHIGHAYLFFGPRGTGKTSLAKIFARTINCENINDGEICGVCASCKEMMDKNCVDIIEIDAASNNGVDEIRDLKSKVNLVPNSLKYKIYIIDEVHMLSIGAFNALLKTLEEPPEHIVFILATTDPQKIPETIKSRCQCFHFKRISKNEIIEKMEEICKNEEVTVDNSVLENIAISSNGGLRDSLTMLDMLYSACGKKITLNDYIELNDLVDESELQILLEEILCGKINDFLQHIEQFNSCGKNLIQICELLLERGKNLIVQFYTENKKVNLNFEFTLLEKFSFLLNENMNNIKRASNPKIYIEIMTLKFINDYVLEKDAIEQNISREIIIEQKFDKKDAEIVDNFSEKVIMNENDSTILNNEISLKSDKKECFNNNVNYDKIRSDFLEKYREIIAIRVDNTLAQADKNILLEVKQLFAKLNEYVFDQEIGYLVCALMDGTVRAASAENIIISLEYDSMIDSNISNMEQLQFVLKKVAGLNQKLAFITDEMWKQKKIEYIQKLQNAENYVYREEPDLPKMPVLEEKDELVSRAFELFGDIVEEE